MHPNELAWLATQARVNYFIVELGSFLGRSSRALADNTPGKLLCVDHWKGPSDVEVAGREHLYEEFLLHLGDRIEQGVVSTWSVDLLTLTQSQVQERLGGAMPDFIFVDADHSYRSVKHDIETWLPFLGPGGLLAGHDYSFNYPGLLKAVTELVPDPKPAPGTDIWYWQKPE